MRLSSRTRAWVTLVAAVLVVVVAVLLARGGSGTTDAASRSSSSRTTSSAGAAGTVDPSSGLRWIDESSLDAQEGATLAEIRTGGPYRYPRNDGVVYHNSNGVLPRESSSYYREFTVVTPGSATRGARRIIAGSAGELYLTTDHYDSFRRIRERR